MNRGQLLQALRRCRARETGAVAALQRLLCSVDDPADLLRVDWQAVDWAKSTAAIASEQGLSKGTVSAMRRKLRPGTISSGGRPTKYAWSDVDWRRTNREIADRLGCDLNAVRYQRARH